MARKVKVDLTGVESFIRAEEGQHLAKLAKIEEKQAESGTDMLVAQFEVIKGSSKGARVYENFPLSEKALWKLKQYLEAIGKKAEGKIALDLDALEGSTCIIEVAHEEYKGVPKAKIVLFKKYEAKAEPNPSRGASQADDSSDDDDDWDE